MKNFFLIYAYFKQSIIQQCIRISKGHTKVSSVSDGLIRKNDGLLGMGRTFQIKNSNSL